MSTCRIARRVASSPRFALTSICSERMAALATKVFDLSLQSFSFSVRGSGTAGRAV